MIRGIRGRFTSSISGLLGLLLVALLLIAGAWAVSAVSAAIPDADGVIHGCYDTGNRTLRVIDTEVGETCRPQEKALSWNQTGPKGPRGPSHGYVTSLRGGPGIPVDANVDVLSLVLPPGDYMLSATARVQRDRAGMSTVVCGSRVGGGAFAPVYAEQLNGVEAVATLAETSGVSVAAGEMVRLTCFAIGDTGSLVTAADLTAIRVGTVTRP